MRTCKPWVVAALFLVSCKAFSQSCSPTTPTPVGPLPLTPFVQNVAHITSGGGFVTKFTIVNLSGSSNTIVFNNISQSGTLIDSTTCTLVGNGTVRLATPEAYRNGASETHWALVGSQLPVGVNLFFELGSSGTNVTTTVGFNDVPAKTSVTFPVEFQPTPPGAAIGRTLGLAVANPNNVGNTVTIVLVDAVNKHIATITLPPLAPFGQTALDLSSNPTIKAALPASDFIGSISVTGTAPIATVGVGDDVGPFFSEAPMSPPPPSGGGGGGTNITGTLTIAPTDPGASIGAGTCSTFGVAATGARSSMAVAVSPNTDPTAIGYSNVIWNAWVDANDHVTVQLCKFAKGTAALFTSLTFNVRVLTTSTSSAAGTLTVAAGSVVPSGACLQAGTAVAGAAPSCAIVLTPAADPGTFGWGGVTSQGFVDTPGHVQGEFCVFAGGSPPASAPVIFNVAVLN